MNNGFYIPTMSKRVKFTNLVIDGSFEDALNNWNCWLTEPTDTSQAKNGSCSLKLGGDALAASKSTISLVAGHKYYGREYIKTAGELTASDCRFELCGAVNGAEKSFVFGWNRGNYPDWTAISDIVTVDGSYDFGLRTFTVGGSCNAWVDSIVVIDLTNACGAGNEPSKEWCDLNIPFFNGSYTVDIPVSSPIQALVRGLTIPEGVVTKIEDASGNVLWNAVKNAKITITSQWDGMDGDSASITVKSSTPFAPDPSNPNNKVTSWTVFVYDQPNRTIEVPVGSTIECTISRDKGNAESYISLNGTNMVTGEGTYIYTVTGDATISIKELYIQGDFGVITIVEADVVVLEVEKQTLTTYAGETSYANESFVLLDIYPENANSTVNVTYGGLTKTLEFSGTNAQQVYFGTFNGVSDDVETPATGILTIEGGCNAFAVGTYQSSSKSTSKGYCSCITNVNNWGIVNYIPDYGLYKCANLTLTELPRGITSIGNNAFYNCKNIEICVIPEGVTSIGANAFYMDDMELTKMWKVEIILPSTIQSMYDSTFMGEENILVQPGIYWYPTSITILAVVPPVLHNPSGAKGNVEKITVPKGCGEAYKAAEDWSKYANYIVELNE